MNNNIYIIYGKDAKSMTKQLLEYADVKRYIPIKSKIAIKPNLVVAKPYTSGATTNPYIVEGIIEYLRENGCENIAILEGAWLGASTKRAFEVCGYTEIAKKYGVKLIDTKDDRPLKVNVDGFELNICSKVYEYDFLINVPLLKGHCQTQLTCALKNLKGLIPDSEKRRFHTLGLHKPIAYLNKAIKTHLVVVDSIMPDPDFEEGGNPVEKDFIALGFDPVLIDSFAAEHLGYNPYDIEYISLAEKLGVGKAGEYNIIEINPEKKPTGFSKRSSIVSRYAKYIEEKDACSVCYANLISSLMRLDEQGLLKKLSKKLYIGQGYKGKAMDGIGIGSCTKAFNVCKLGCPPKSNEIVEFLKQNL